MDERIGRAPSAPAAPPRSVGVLGGGTAGYFTALALRARFPDLDVTVVESPDVPVIGVGEATTTLMPPFLHAELGVDVVSLFAAVRPTFKLGIRFDWGLPAPHVFTYPFGDADPLDAYVHDGHLRDQSLVSMLMLAGRAPLLRDDAGAVRSLLPRLKFAYHLDNAPFVAFLARIARERGIGHRSATVVRVRRGDGGVEALDTAEGDALRFDLYVDATGFRAELIGGALGSPFESYATSLFCDRAWVGTLDRAGPSEPYTTAETMDAGWCWRIPVTGEDHRGYVFASAFLDDARAADELVRKNPGIRDLRMVRFRSGRRRDFWRGDVVAVGNAYGFVEPLESTALHMLIVELGYLVAGLEAWRSGDDVRALAASASASVGAHWDFLRWFLAVHYRYNRRLDTEFWRAARAEVDVSGLAEYLDRYERTGAYLRDGASLHAPSDPAFGHSGLMMMLLGQGVAAPTIEPVVDAAGWRARVAAQRRLVDRALPQDEALAVLHARPDLLREVARPGASWCMGDAERVLPAPRVGARVRPDPSPRSGSAVSRPDPRDPDDALFRALRAP